MRNTIDAFNGDADGLLARHQFRLSHPVPPVQLTLISGVKRDIALLERVLAMRKVQDGDAIQVFDVSYDRNAVPVGHLLDAGARITYFDHHRAGLLQPHQNLCAHIDESPNTCTSLLVDRFCHGKHRLWAIAAAFGDNLTAIAWQLSAEAGLVASQSSQLKLLGECLNYNSYGNTVADLHIDPVALANRLQPYEDPLDFIRHEDVLSRLKQGFDDDFARALAVAPMHESRISAVYLMPDQAWAHRISGALANHLVNVSPSRAHVVMTPVADGKVTVSIRAPASAPRDAERVASSFAGGGGRAIAAGIEAFSIDELPRLITLLEKTYR